MSVESKGTGRALPIPKGVMLGLAGGICWTCVCVAVISALIANEVIAFDWIGYGIVFVLITASFICAELSYRKIKSRRMLISMIAACSYYMVLIAANALFFQGQYAGVWVTMLCVFGGATVSLLLGVRQEKRRFRSTYKNKRF